MKEMADATPKSQAILPFTLPPPGLGGEGRLGPLVPAFPPALQSRGFHQLISSFPPFLLI